METRMEKLDLGKYDVLIIKSRLNRKQVQELQAKIKRKHPTWKGVSVSIDRDDTLQNIPGAMAFDLCKKLMQQFFPELYEVVALAEQNHRKATEESEAASTNEEPTEEATSG